MLGYLTASTCGDACWHAREEICRCSCAGANHGILNRGGARPQRTRRIDGHLYELAGIIARQPGECVAETWRRVNAARAALEVERFPRLDPHGYGEYREGGRTLPVVDRAISGTQARWSEVAAVPGAVRLIWSRPAGSRYRVRTPDYKGAWAGGAS